MRKTKAKFKSEDISLLKELLADGKKHKVFDLRDEYDFKQGHIKGTVNVPFHEFNEDIDLLVPDKSEEIYLFCYSGKRSRLMCSLLYERGYLNAVNLGGINKWKNELVSSKG